MADVVPTAGQGVTENHYLVSCLCETRRAVTSVETHGLRLTLLDVNDLIRRLAPRLRRILRKQRTLALSLAPDVALTVADAKHLEEALIEVALSARRVMPADGSLWIATRNVGAPHPSADHSLDGPRAPTGLISIQTRHTGGDATLRICLPRVF
jgi:hypothetical protein